MTKILGKRNSTPAERQAMLSMAHSGIPHTEIAKAFSCSLSTVGRTLCHFKVHGHSEDLPRSGRPGKLGERNLRHLRRIVETNRRQTLGEITETVNNL